MLIQEVNNEKDEDGTKNLWAELKKIGVEDDSVGVVYMYLLKNPIALKGFNGVPIHQRKNMLPIIVPDYQPKESNRNVTVDYTYHLFLVLVIYNFSYSSCLIFFFNIFIRGRI
ncbi:hypothetical protein V8G54_031532 [Vigna mungo]|uniref:Uncharacterized protein n=1 Tax=Vigna mungo TaxID=3915 RepID=A0AAQ3MLA5_VIGMU